MCEALRRDESFRSLGYSDQRIWTQITIIMSRRADEAKELDTKRKLEMGQIALQLIQQKVGDLL